jgi:hypothetical protein
MGGLLRRNPKAGNCPEIEGGSSITGRTSKEVQLMGAGQRLRSSLKDGDVTTTQSDGIAALGEDLPHPSLYRLI